MATAAARSIFRSSSAARCAFRAAAEAKSSRSTFFRMASNKPLSQSTRRIPVELSFCVESMMPLHTATASALMNSMLAISRHRCGWIPEGNEKACQGRFSRGLIMKLLDEQKEMGHDVITTCIMLKTFLICDFLTNFCTELVRHQFSEPCTPFS
ncbi:hypothetical protein Ahy_A03g015200 isoform B [Arachis hypogaea]|uniref:Protein NUCLEAR FUSION DEFECTIVE 6 n=1 Tax=Arachis hypogaea TaxID=3818 RepID=A0A445DZU5_ARAHY|nr:hypothetical protein Ahy_A03g015200 isoform B [Arachis hypogaea]